MQLPISIPPLGSMPGAARNVVGSAGLFVVRIPGTVVGEVSRRLRVPELATKRDVEVQSRLARKRVARILEEFLKEQRDHEDALIASLRSDIREELQSFADAVADEDFGIDEALQPYVSPSRRPLNELDYDEDEEDDEDLVDLSAEELARIVNE